MTTGLAEASKFNFTNKYAKYLPEKHRRETWSETVKRVKDMHLAKYSFLSDRDKNTIEDCFQAVEDKRVMPSMRSLQFAGEGIERNNARMYNCGVVHICNTRAIEKAFYLMLSGVGMGFGLTRKYTDQFPNLTIRPVKERQEEHLSYYFATSRTYLIPDSIEGWAESTKVLLDSYLEGNKASGLDVIFDYSEIRPAGTSISIGGKAPGHEGLEYCHDKIREVLDRCIRKGKTKLESIDIYDVLMHISDAVLSGGQRRAATIALFDKDDTKMLKAKVGNWFEKNPQRARSNNSILLNRENISHDEFLEIFKHVKEFGEPGFAFCSNENTVYNPCLEIGMIPIYNGVPSVQFCNLTTINGTKVNSHEEFLNAVEVATVLGTLQSGYTDFPFLDLEDKLMTESEALLGVSLLGSLSNPEILLNEKTLFEGALLAKQVNKQWATKIKINSAARITCQKPDGNSSVFLESPFSGIHPAHSPFYIRRIQVNKNDNTYKHFKNLNPEFCENSVWSQNGQDAVISFPVKVQGTPIYKKDLTALQHLDIVKKVQNKWVKSGSNNNKASHNVSCTVLVEENEWDSIAEYLFKNKNDFVGLSFLPDNGDKIYAQAPYEKITEEQYEEMIAKLKLVDYTTMYEQEDYTAAREEVSCVGGACAI